MGDEVTDALVVLYARLSPHLDKASGAIARFPFFRKRHIELEPEERLAIYLRLKAMKRKMGEPDWIGNGIGGRAMEGVEHEGPVVSGDADIDSRSACSGGDSGEADDGHSERDAGEHRGADQEDKRDDRRHHEIG